MFWSILLAFIRLFRKQQRTIPHPEAERVVGLKADDIDVQSLLNDWFVEWEVLDKQYFLTVDVKLVNNLTVNFYGKVPAATYSNEMRIELDPEWANAGVLAHEMAHVSYYNLLSESHQAEFEAEYKKVLGEDSLLQYVVSVKPYMRAGSPIECHADCYRYLGQQMPETLKQYYPNLL